MGLVDQLANAIARMESGNFNPSSIAMRQNNPGNLRSWGNYPVENGYVKFPDYETGMKALRSQVQKNIDRGLNLYEFFGGKAGVYAGYAPAADNNKPRSYAETVAGWIGLSPDANLKMISVSSWSREFFDGDFQLPAIQTSGGGEVVVSPVVVAALAIGGAALLWWAFA